MPFSFSVSDLAAAAVAIVVLAALSVQRCRAKSSANLLDGPPSPNFLVGIIKDFFLHDDPPSLHLRWSEEYGPAFTIPKGILQPKAIVLCDPKAQAHFRARETTTYVNTKSRRAILDGFLGLGVLSAEGDNHRRLRNALTPAFSNASVRQLTSIFFDHAHKVKDNWNNQLSQSNGIDVIIDVQGWMNRISLDSMGVGIFSKDFDTLSGSKSAKLASIFDSFTAQDIGIWSKLVSMITMVFPMFLHVPNHGRTLRTAMKEECKVIAADIRKAEDQELTEDKKPWRLLMKSERSTVEKTRTTIDEGGAQVATLVLAGYETTSVSMTWVFLELARHPDTQDKLRQELLSKYPVEDPTWDQLWYDAPYLDAVVLESLRFHTIVPEIPRMAREDDVIPFSRPVRTKTGEMVDSLFISKGTVVHSSIGYLNRAKELWGEDAEEFKPERWLNLDQHDELRAKEIQGHKHLMSFSDGPRICLGKNYALAEIKAVLSVLIRNYRFELRDGKNTQFEMHTGMLKRPKMTGSVRAELPLRVTKVEQ